VTLAPEQEALLLLARPPSPARRRRLEVLLAGDLDWDALLDLVARHGLAPLLQRALSGPVAIPDRIRETLMAMSRAWALRAAVQREELASVLHALSADGVAAMPLKGAAVAERHYGDPDLRAYSDLDVLVRRDEVGRAHEVLHRLGYAADRRERLLDLERDLRRTEGGWDHVLELHWGLGWGGRPDRAALEDLWSEARPAAVAGAPAWVPTAEWEFLVLADHFGRHEWRGLKWLLDLDAVARHSAFDWGRTLSKADRFECRESVDLAGALCHRLLATPVPVSWRGMPVPPDVNPFADPADRGSLARRVRAASRLLRPSERVVWMIRTVLRAPPPDGGRSVGLARAPRALRRAVTFGLRAAGDALSNRERAGYR
jgi:hypothetical protein